MDHFRSGKLPRLDLSRRELADAARKFGPIQIAESDDISRKEVAFATRDAWREQALASFAQRLLGPFINE